MKVTTVNGVAPDSSGKVTITLGGAMASVRGRTGAVTLTKADVTGLGLAAADIGAITAALAHADAAPPSSAAPSVPTRPH